MKLLVIGSGGREHALAWRLAQSPRVHKVYVAPGNGGTQGPGALENLPLTQADELADFAEREGIALTVVGPEAPLAAGVVDTFRQRRLKIFGPTRAAAQLESSKDYAKAFMVRHNIPTAKYQTFTDPALAHAYIDAESPNQSTPLMLAAQYGSQTMVQLLLDAGADVQARNQLGLTAVDFARRSERAFMVEILEAAYQATRRSKASW